MEQHGFLETGSVRGPHLADWSRQWISMAEPEPVSAFDADVGIVGGFDTDTGTDTEAVRFT
jgi:hypothetical protein